MVGDEVLDIGTVVKVKCTISDWKGVRQLELKRIHTVRSTEDEVKAWKEVVRWKRDILDRPWVLTQKQLDEIGAQVATESKKRRDEERAKEERRRLRAEKRAAWAAKMKKYEDKAAMKRRKEEVVLNAGALK